MLAPLQRYLETIGLQMLTTPSNLALQGSLYAAPRLIYQTRIQHPCTQPQVPRSVKYDWASTSKNYGALQVRARCCGHTARLENMVLRVVAVKVYKQSSVKEHRSVSKISPAAVEKPTHET